MRIDLAPAQGPAFCKQVEKPALDRGPLTILYSPSSIVHNLVQNICFLANTHRQEQTNDGGQRRQSRLRHSLRKRDLGLSQNGQRIDKLHNLFHVRYGGLVYKSKHHALDGLIPERDNDQVPNPDLPGKEIGHCIIENPGHGRDINDDLNIGTHRIEYNLKTISSPSASSMKDCTNPGTKSKESGIKQKVFRLLWRCFAQPDMG